MKVIDMHCDTIGGLFHLKEEGKPQSLRRNSGHIDLERLRESHYLLQNFAMFIPLGRCGDPWEAVCAMYRYYLEELERNRDILAPVLRYEDIGRNEASGKISSLLTVEEGGVCKGELEKLGELYRMGVRMITLTWNFDNEIGHPNFDGFLRERLEEAGERLRKCTPGTEGWEQQRLAVQAARDACMHTPNVTGGLTPRGREFVEEMERLEQTGTTFQDKQKQDAKPVRYAGAVVMALLTTALMAALIVLMVWAFTVDPADAPPLALLLVLVAIPGVIILGVLLALFQRIKEIQKGEEDDAKNY